MRNLIAWRRIAAHIEAAQKPASELDLASSS